MIFQTFGDFELIVVNDGSNDRTAEILFEYERVDRRIRVHHQVRSGIVASLNTALGLSSGEYIARMDADDIAFADRFERQVDFLRAHPEIGLLGGAAVVVDVASKEIGSMQFPSDDRSIRSALETTSPFCHPTTMVRRSVFTTVGGYRTAFPHAEDYDLWLRISEHCQMANLGEPVLYYRWHAGQVSVRLLEQQLVEAVAANHSARLRRSGREDLVGNGGPASLELLEQLGLDHRMFESQLLTQTAARAALLVSLGLTTDARDMLDRALASSEISSIDGRVRAHLGITYARASFAEGSSGSALAWLLKAVAAHPASVVQTAWRGARDVLLPRARSRFRRGKPLNQAQRA
jgi:hypothetical protein